jgi:hypothetical protein
VGKGKLAVKEIKVGRKEKPTGLIQIKVVGRILTRVKRRTGRCGSESKMFNKDWKMIAT